MKTIHHWEDIFKILDTNIHTILEVLDSRNPEGTHNEMIENFIKKNHPNIRLILVLNKADMVPKKVLASWHQYFREKSYEIYAISAKYSKGIEFLLKKFRILAQGEEFNILVVGYPNTGKSSLIEALTKGKKRVGVSSNAGFTRSITKIRLFGNVYLFDSPGVIPIDETNETEIAIKACMTADKIEDPLAVVESIFQLIPYDEFNKVYSIDLKDSDGIDDLIQKIGKKYGRLLSGGRINENDVQKMIIRDWQNNKLHFYIAPPSYTDNNDYLPSLAEIEATYNNQDLVPLKKSRASKSTILKKKDENKNELPLNHAKKKSESSIPPSIRKKNKKSS